MTIQTRVSDTRGIMFGIDQSARTKKNVEGFHFFYNIETAVGLGQPNHRPSSLLVQHMLNVFLSRYGSQLGLRELPVNGVVGSETDRSIRAFQNWLEVSPHAGSVPVDGIVAPVTCPFVDGPHGRYVPSLLLLNRLWASIEPHTFSNPATLGHVIGEDLAMLLWQGHPDRCKQNQPFAPAEPPL